MDGDAPGGLPVPSDGVGCEVAGEQDGKISVMSIANPDARFLALIALWRERTALRDV
jgi:hypothetical protein